MNVVFEKGRKSEMDIGGVDNVTVVDLNEVAKQKLRDILDDAGVDYNPRLGEAKLKALVDELPAE